MKILRFSTLSSKKMLPPKTALTIGNFDGGHRGHQALLKQLAASGLPMLVITFEPTSREFFALQRQEPLPARLSNFREKFEFLQQSGVAYWLILPFSKIVAWEASRFASFVLETLHARVVLIGEDFRFGKNRAGDVKFLQQYAQSYGATVEQFPAFCTADGERISSSRVRQCLTAGDLSAAQTLLGRPYTLIGRVCYGQQLARTLGFPTANLPLKRLLPPCTGVFVVEVTHCREGWRRFGVANLGKRPTVAGEDYRLEVHLFGYSGNLYGALLRVALLVRLRPEKRFASIADLQAAIAQDVAAAQQWLHEHGLQTHP